MAKEMLVPFIIGTVTVVLMFQANLLIAILKNINAQGVPMGALAQFILLKTPFFLNMTFPVGMALASSLAMSRITRESELTAMRSAGVSILRVVRPVLVFGLLVSIGNFLIVERVMPRSEQAATRLQTKIVTLGAAPLWKDNFFIRLKNYKIIADSISRGAGETINMVNLVMLESRSNEETMLITAPKAEYRAGEWTVFSPFVRVFRRTDLVAAYSSKPLVIKERIVLEDIVQQKSQEEMTLSELRRAMDTARQQNRDVAPLEIEFWTRFSVPAACLIFSLTGPIFAVWFARAGAFVGVLLSLVLVLVYYNAFVISREILGRYGYVNPILAAFLPDILFITFGLVVLRKLE